MSEGGGDANSHCSEQLRTQCNEDRPRFDGEHLEQERPATAERKRTFIDLTGGAESRLSKRQKAWLSRSHEEVQPSAYRPATLQRTVAHKWLLAVDAQLRNSTAHLGLKFFVYDESLPIWADWRHWPTLAIAQDLGSDGVAAHNAMAHLFDMCVWQFVDPSHAAQRSFDGALRAAGLWDMWLLAVVTWNLEYGPWLGERRRTELAEASHLLYQRYSPSEVPLFNEYAPLMIVELEKGG